MSKKLMKNIDLVTTYLSQKNYHSLEIVKTKKNKIYYKHHKTYWRCYKFIENARTYETIDDLLIIEQMGIAIGQFEKIMLDYPLDKLYISIPNFHNSSKRLEQFIQALRRNKRQLKHTIRKEIRFILSHSPYFSIIEKGIINKTIRLIPTHNDTKINNIMIDNNNKSVCLIDFDTIMPGTILYDYGDAIRSIALIGKEDEIDLSIIDIDLTKFHSFTKGYLSIMEDNITNEEINHLVDSIIIITLECSMRFLTDYLDGDVYFHVDDPMQNLRRARVGIKFVKKIEEKKEQLEKIIFDMKSKK